MVASWSQPNHDAAKRAGEREEALGSCVEIFGVDSFVGCIQEYL